MSAPTRLALLLLLALALPVRAGEVDVKLTTGSRLRGEIVAEDERGIDLRLGDGMKMRIRRDMIESIEPVAPAPGPEPAPEPAGEDAPRAPAPAPPAPDEADAAATRRGGGDPGWFERSPAGDWNTRYGSWPTLVAARLTRFRAYEYVGHSPLAVAPTDEQLREVVAAHGHGGFLARWTFRYAGMLELRYGDEVRFVAELTSPEEEELRLLRLEQGPTPVTTRLAVFLVRRGAEVRRLATTTAFDNGAFRQADLDALATTPMPVRTCTGAYAPVAATNLTPGESDFLEGILSPFGDSLRVRLLRYRFRVKWLEAPPEDRPALDPELLRRNAARPLARPGGEAASEAAVLRTFGDAETNRRRVRELQREIREDLARIGVKPGGDYRVERDRIGPAGERGVTIVTRRYRLDREMLGELLGDGE